MPSKTVGSKISHTEKKYHVDRNVVFCKVAEVHGILSNMHKSNLVLNGITFRSSEALYQSLKFVDPEIQLAIAGEKSPMAAKAISRKHKPEIPDWNQKRILAMMWVVMTRKLLDSNFRESLNSTKDLRGHIVELSTKDPYWGALPQWNSKFLIGQNCLGQILELVRDANVSRMDSTRMGGFFLNGRELPEVNLEEDDLQLF